MPNKDYIPQKRQASEEATPSTTSTTVTASHKPTKRRPARKQVEPGQVEKKEPEQSGQSYNIWFNKWAGGDKFDSYNIKEKAQTRCIIAKDAGYTRADVNNNPYCCLFFARGCCPLGHDCNYLHRLPVSQAVLPDTSMDVFGREKHSGYRDDMGGVGSFNRQNRTLYVGRIRCVSNIEQTVEQHFEEWGEIERIKILQARGVAFVTYVSELNAQFAKEAMMHQSMDNDEVLNVRWATDDPDPKAKVRESKRTQEIGEQGLASAITPEFVRQVRQEDELNGLVDPLPEDDEDDEQEQQQQKRPRLIEPGQQEDQQDHSSIKAGLLSQTALQSLQSLKNFNQPSTNTQSNGSGGLAGLADYASDDDD